MTLWAVKELWEVQNDSGFWDSFILNEIVNKTALINYLMLEYGEMSTIDNDSRVFRHRVETFFQTHKWNIDKLAESLEFEYDPIHNSRWHEKEDWTRDENIDFTRVHDDDWTEDGRTDETDTNYVSAYNDTESREGNIIDVEHHRDVIDIDYDKKGTDDYTTDEDTSEHEEYHQTHDEWGHKQNNTFQQLIEEERQQAQFNIYKWIGKHFCLECLISIW